MKATPEHFNQLAGEKPVKPLNYPRFLDSEYQRLVRDTHNHLRDAERHRRKQRIKGNLVTGTWAVSLIGFSIALIVWS